MLLQVSFLEENGEGDGLTSKNHVKEEKVEKIETVVIEQVLDSNLTSLDGTHQMENGLAAGATMVIAPTSTVSEDGTTVYTTITTIPAGSLDMFAGSPESSSTVGDFPMSPSSGGGKMKRRASGKEEKLLCLVCGDRALGCNFDAISCESCKAFFRRNALKTKPTKCLFDRNCKIDVNTRRFCPHCRLKKCFDVGMKKQFILGDEEKKKRMQKVINNRTKKTSVKQENDGGPSTPHPEDDSMPGSPTPSVLSNPATPAPPPLVQPATPPPAAMVSSAPLVHTAPQTPGTASSIVQHIPGSLTTLSALPSDLSSLPASAAALISSMASIVSSSSSSSSLALSSSPGTTTVTFPTPDIPAGATEILNSQTIAEAVHQAIQLQVMQQTQNMDISNLLSLSKLIKPTDMYSSQVDSFLVRKLTTEESAMLGDLMQIYDLSFTVDLEPLIHIKQIDPSLDQLVNQSSITVLRIIKFAKRLEEFVKLPQECQIGILKGCWIHILLLRSVSVYDSVRDVWGTPRGDIPTEILKNATGYDQLHDDHINYCKSIKSIIRDDLTIVVILIVIVLFSPEGPHVMTRELVSNIQDRYLVLLKHYLESKYTYVRSAEMFPQLISKMKELKELAEVHGRVLLDVNPSEIEPIMLEILDLK